MKKYRANNSFYTDSDYQIQLNEQYPSIDPKIYIGENNDDDYYDEYDEYSNDRKIDMDYESMKSMYPEMCKRIQMYIDEECNRLDYEGSAMYDDMVDAELIEIIVDRINERLKDEGILDGMHINEVDVNENDVNEEEEKLEATQYYRYVLWPRELVKVMLLNDIFGRRYRRHFRRRNRYRTRPYPGYGYGSGRRYPYPTHYQYPYQRMRSYR